MPRWFKIVEFIPWLLSTCSLGGALITWVDFFANGTTYTPQGIVAAAIVGTGLTLAATVGFGLIFIATLLRLTLANTKETV